MSYNKYYTYKKQVSYDGGITWVDVFPNEFQPSGSSIGTYNTLEECEGGTPSINGKYKFTLSDSSVVSAECDSTSAITSAETSVYRNRLIEAEIGDCVRTIEQRAFSNCTNLSSIDISNSVTSIGDNAFINCESLTNVVIPSSVTSLGGAAFASCSGLTSVSIPNSITTIDVTTFMACYSLSSITIPNSVEIIEYRAFRSCSGMTSVTIGSGITRIGQEAFQNCSGLTSITIHATTPPVLGSSSGFAKDEFDNTNNCPIYVPSESVEAYKTASRWSAYSDRIQAIS